MAIDVWLIALDVAPTEIAALAPLLDEEERTQAERFRHAQDRTRFIARRGRLRQLLATYLGRPPAFDRNAYGKPSVRGGGDLRFNVSHSDGLALCVVGEVELGCDIERRNPALADPDVAERLFAPGEWRCFAALPEDQRIEGFFNCWTRKEAFIKAIGLGVSHPLDSFEVSLAPGDTPALLGGGEGWSIASFEAAPGYQAALVTAGDAASSMTPPRRFSGDAARVAPGES
ncbi:MAG: 4-phosphopantetheinyl transferase superfamily protein [Sphingomonas bacterium]|jgi:4'-phosphopantetheinyl transferase|nr:4-phosphopantetheinyl transferase superfamily protein [Sphingomonas bacterium]